MGSAWRNKAILYGLITGMAGLIVVYIGMGFSDRLFVQWNILFFALISLISMALLARTLLREIDFMGFNELLKPMMVLFIFSYLVYTVGFFFFEKYINPEVSGIKYEISKEQFEKFQDQMDDLQREQAQKVLNNRENFEPGFSLQGFLFSFALFFAVIGLPESIFVAAIANRGFHNEKKETIERDP